MIGLTKLAGAVHIWVLVRILRWQARLGECAPMGSEDPLDENRLSMLPDHQTIPTDQDYSQKV